MESPNPGPGARTYLPTVWPGPVPWDFIQVELVTGWKLGSLRGWLGGVSVLAGPFARGAGLGHREFHSSQTQVSQHRPRTKRSFTGGTGRGRPGRPGSWERACVSVSCWAVSADLGVFCITCQGDCQQPSPLMETRVCVVLNKSRD